MPMPQTTQKTPNNYYNRAKIARITKVYPQTRTVDVVYLSQSGELLGLLLPYTSVGLTGGSVSMPKVDDKVIVDYVDGDRPIITGMYPGSENLLPYTYPGEQGLMGTNGSFVHIKEPRKRIKSTGELLNYNQNQGKNGETDIEYEPGGITLQIQSLKDKNGNAPRYDKHGYISLFDNGTIAIHSVYQGTSKGMLHMEGQSGHVWLSSGNGSPQEYIELDPLLKNILFFSDGEIHKFVQTDDKSCIYGNTIVQSGGGLDIKLGIPLNSIQADFAQFQTNVAQGDISIDNSLSSSGKTNLNLKGDFSLNVVEGNITFTSQNGNISVEALNGSINLSAKSGIYATGASGQGNDPVVTKSTFDAHRHYGSPIPNQTAEPIEPAPNTEFYA